MSELAFPELDTGVEVLDPAPAPAAPAPSQLALLREHNLAELSAVDKGIAALRAEHGSTAYDITTPLGYKLATTRRHAVRQARYQVPKIVAARKKELKALGSEIEAEADRIVKALLLIEEPHDSAIEAEDKRREAVKAEKDRLEAERVAKHQAGIERIRGYLTTAQQPGMTAERIAMGISMLEPVRFTKEAWQEFAVPAANAQCETLEAMRQLHAAAVEREAEARRLEEQRAEQARVAAELAERQRQLDEQAAAIKAQADALAAEKAAKDAQDAQRAADQLRWDQIFWAFDQANMRASSEQAVAVRDAFIEAHGDPDLWALGEIGARYIAELDALQPDPIVPDDPDAAPAATLEEMGGEKPDPASYDGMGPIATAPAVEPPTKARKTKAPAAQAITLTKINAALGFELREAFITTELHVDPDRIHHGLAHYTPTQLAALKAALIKHIQGVL